MHDFLCLDVQCQLAGRNKSSNAKAITLGCRETCSFVAPRIVHLERYKKDKERLIVEIMGKRGGRGLTTPIPFLFVYSGSLYSYLDKSITGLLAANDGVWLKLRRILLVGLDCTQRPLRESLLGRYRIIS